MTVFGPSKRSAAIQEALMKLSLVAEDHVTVHLPARAYDVLLSDLEGQLRLSPHGPYRSAATPLTVHGPRGRVVILSRASADLVLDSGRHSR